LQTGAVLDVAVAVRDVIDGHRGEDAVDLPLGDWGAEEPMTAVPLGARVIGTEGEVGWHEGHSLVNSARIHFLARSTSSRIVAPRAANETSSRMARMGPKPRRTRQVKDGEDLVFMGFLTLGGGIRFKTNFPH
jgi:hypothetical protein